MIRSINTITTKTYCLECDTITETINKKKEFWEKGDIYIIKGNCEVCNVIKVEKCAHRYGDRTLLT